jgi:hypothetical protein
VFDTKPSQIRKKVADVLGKVLKFAVEKPEAFDVVV